jgi:hypothetical protein
MGLLFCEHPVTEARDREGAAMEEHKTAKLKNTTRQIATGYFAARSIVCNGRLFPTKSQSMPAWPLGEQSAAPRAEPVGT